MKLGLQGKQVLITGGSRGIGLACAKAFAAEGCHLHLVARGKGQLETARSEIMDFAAVDVTAHSIDLSRPGAAEAAARACGAVDVLVNNAGAIPGGSIETVDEALWREAWDLKVFGYINMTRAILPGMVERKSGVIVNIIGLAGAKPSFDYICGASGNAALMAFTRGLGAGTTRNGVRVVGINPSVTRTDRTIGLYKARAEAVYGDASRWEEMLANLPFSRQADPGEVAALAVFSASERASYLSGTVIDIDGGTRFR